MPDKLLIISPYPSKTGVYDNQYSALASYAKNTVESIIKKKKKLKVLVLADRIPEGKNWRKANVEVKRVWSRNNIFTYLPLVIQILKNNDIKKILIEMEWALFGRNPFILALWPLFLLFLKLLKKDVSIVMHGIAVDFMKLSPQLGLDKKSLKSRLFDVGIKLFYQTIITFSTRIIVLEKYFAELINSFYKTDKAVYIPHGVDTVTTAVSKKRARNILGIKQNSFVILNFGFINWYKGSDILVNLFRQFINKEGKRKRKVHLIMAGGVSNIHHRDKIYRIFTEDILADVAIMPQIKLTGYLPEKSIGLYFAASDLIILPYRLFISSSGPLSFALSYKKPFLLSSNLSGYFRSPDFKSGLTQSKIKEADLIFDFNLKSFSQSLSKITKKINKAKKLSSFLYNQRKWPKIAFSYISLLKLK